MTISASLKPLDLRDELEAANMKGKNLTFLDDYSKEELTSLQGRRTAGAVLREPDSACQQAPAYTVFPAEHAYPVQPRGSHAPPRGARDHRD
ncbi:MAG: hypothetical protein ACLR0N_19540 [Bilophila wadsworthia]